MQNGMVQIYQRPREIFNNEEVSARLLAEEKLNSTAELIFKDYSENGFCGKLALGYNALVSAKNYLKTGLPMHGSRTGQLLAEEEESDMERDRR